MSITKRNKNGNNDPNWDLMLLIIRYEFAIELGRIRLEKKRRKTLEAERQIANLFNKAYELVKSGASRKKIANILKQIKEIAQRSGFIEDHKS